MRGNSYLSFLQASQGYNENLSTDLDKVLCQDWSMQRDWQEQGPAEGQDLSNRNHNGAHGDGQGMRKTGLGLWKLTGRVIRYFINYMCLTTPQNPFKFYPSLQLKKIVKKYPACWKQLPLGLNTCGEARSFTAFYETKHFIPRAKS